MRAQKVPVETGYVCHVFQLNKAVTCWCCDIDAHVSNAFDACVCIAEANNLVLDRLVLGEARLVVADVCICAIVEAKVVIVLMTSCSTKCISGSSKGSSGPSLSRARYCDRAGLACRFLRLIICITARPEVRQCDIAAREASLNLLTLAMTSCDGCDHF